MWPYQQASCRPSGTKTLSLDLRERILASHKDQTALELIRQAGAEVRLFLSYSPDLNPIEKMWSKIKTLLRGLAARTQDELSGAITQAFKAITPEDAKGWFSSCYITTLKS